MARHRLGQTPIGKIFFAARGLYVMCDLGDGSPIQTQGFGGWEEVERPGQKSITRWRGRQPWKITIPIMLDRFDEGDDGVSVESEVRTLERLAGGGTSTTPPVLSFDSGGLVPHDYHDNPRTRWVIDGIEFGEVIRNAYGNRVRCEMVVTVLEYVEGPDYVESSAAKRSQGKHPNSSSSHSKLYVVKKGDTLISIARKKHVAGGWRAIQKLNPKKAKNPRKLVVGTTLRLP